MAVLLGSTRMETNPLSEAYFTRAAGDLNVHRHSGAERVCAACEDAWPCAKALAAAFVLELH